jgi:hypothetical protein
MATIFSSGSGKGTPNTPSYHASTRAPASRAYPMRLMLSARATAHVLTLTPLGVVVDTDSSGPATTATR